MQTLSLEVTAEDHRIAMLAALAVGLGLAEAMLPSPIPGIKPGLANIVILLVARRYGWSTAAWVALIRLLAGSLLLGQFLAPGFLLAAVGSVCSLGVLALCAALPARWFGAVSVSVLMAHAHLGGQWMLAKLWLFPEANLLVLLPVFALAALCFGTVNGLIVAHLESSPDAQGARA